MMMEPHLANRVPVAVIRFWENTEIGVIADGVATPSGHNWHAGPRD